MARTVTVGQDITPENPDRVKLNKARDERDVKKVSEKHKELKRKEIKRQVTGGVKSRPIRVKRWVEQFCDATKIADEPELNRGRLWEDPNHYELDRKYKLLTRQV